MSKHFAGGIPTEMITTTTVTAKLEPTAFAITIEGNKGPLVGIRHDGTIEYGIGYDPDVAARIFWEALAAHMPSAVKMGDVEKPESVVPPPEDTKRV